MSKLNYDIGWGGGGEGADFLIGGWVHDFHAVVGFGVDEFAADEELRCEAFCWPWFFCQFDGLEWLIQGPQGWRTEVWLS